MSLYVLLGVDGTVMVSGDGGALSESQRHERTDGE